MPDKKKSILSINKFVLPVIRSLLRGVTVKIDVEKKVLQIKHNNVVEEFTFNEIEAAINANNAK